MAKALGVDFTNSKKEVKVLTESSHKTLDNYAEFRAKRNIKWTGSEIDVLIWHLFNVIDGLESLEVSPTIVKPRDIAIDPENYFLKIYNFVEYKPHSSSKNEEMQSSQDTILCTKAEVLNPNLKTDNRDLCLEWMRKNYPQKS